ncbi:MAG: hypothetical protein WD960_13790 [Gemmatimonadota bacterium]
MTDSTGLPIHQEAADALKRIQEFDPDSLVREKELGASLNFAPAVEPARRLVELYKRLTLLALEDFPEQQLEKIKKQANSDYGIFTEILEFSTNQQSPHELRTSLIDKLTKAYQPAFNTLHPFISFSLHRSADFQQLDRDARAALQEIRDQATAVLDELGGTRGEAKQVLEEARRVAGEVGVAHQAEHFKRAAEEHGEHKETWRDRTVKLAWGLGVFALVSFLIHKIPWLAPETTYDTVQLAISKLLVFATISYMLYLSARNFMSHKHNEIVNRHRQDALMTYRALVEATESPANRDVVLTYAAACIFAPQGTGYTSDSDGGGPPRNVVELLTRQLSEE